MSANFKPCGVITITTDFGHKGPFVGTIKGVILTRFPDARMIDVTHETLAHWPAEAGFWLARAYQYYPRGSIHLAVVDPGVGTERDVIIVVRDGHCFIAPDNGLLALLIRNEDVVYQVTRQALEQIGVTTPSATFHGRDVFAPMAAELAAGRVSPEAMGVLTTDFVPSWLEEPVVTQESVSGQVVTVDNFGNLITNIDAHLVASFSHPITRVGSRRIVWKRTYGEVEPGQYLSLVNSFGVVEIARAEQSASEGLGIERGAPVVVQDRRDSDQ